MSIIDTLNKNKPLPPIPEPLDRATLLETLDTFHQSLSHTRYAVSGLAALAVWGYTSRLPTRVTIMCCSSDKQIIRTWAKVSGWYVYPNQPDVIGLPGKGGNGFPAIRQIRLRGFANEETFEWPERVCPAREACSDDITPTQAMVLTPTALLNQFCQNYSLSIQRSNGEVAQSSTHPDRPQQTRAEHAQRAAETAELILWILQRMVRIPPRGDFLDQIPHVMDPRFRIAFTENYPSSVALFTQCGLDLDVWVPRPYDCNEQEAWLTSSGAFTPGKRPGSVFYAADSPRLDTAASSSWDTSSTAVSNGDCEVDEDILATQWHIPDDLREMMEDAELEYKAKEFWR